MKSLSVILMSVLVLACVVVLFSATTTMAQQTNLRALVPGEVVLNCYMMGAGKTAISETAKQLAEKLNVDASRFESGSVSFSSKSETLFQFIVIAGSNPSAFKLAEDAGKLSKDELRAIGIDRPPTLFVTTPAPPPPEQESSTMRTVLIIGGAALSGALLSLIVAALFCKPRSSEVEERKQKQKQAETKAKIEAEMQVQHLVRSAAFQRLQERVIGLEKEESVRKAVNEVEDTTKRTRGVAKEVARELLDEPFVEQQDREQDKHGNNKRGGSNLSNIASRLDLANEGGGGKKVSEEEFRRQRAADMVENAPWWHNSALQAQITADLAVPRYAGLKYRDDEDDDDDLDLLAPFGAGRLKNDAEARNKARAERTKKRNQTAKIPDQLIDYSAIQLISQGHHWLAYNELPKMNPKIESLVMLAKSNLHGVGVFARRFIDRGTLLFPYANPSQINCAKHVYSRNEMRYHFGVNWDARLHFVARDAYNKKFCVAEAPRERGWGCAINSSRGTGNMLMANCECFFPDDKQAGVIPWVRVTQTIPPLGELLLDYPYPEMILQQRGLDPDAIDDEPPPVAFSTYGASLKVPLLSAAIGHAAPVPRQNMDINLPPPPPPPPMPASNASAPTAVAGLLDLPPPPPPNDEDLPPSAAGAAVINIDEEKPDL